MGEGSPGSRELEGERGEGCYTAQTGRRPGLLVYWSMGISIVRWKTPQPDETHDDLILNTSQDGLLVSVLTNSLFQYPVKPLVVSSSALLAVWRRYDVLTPLCSASEVQRMVLVPGFGFSNCSLFSGLVVGSRGSTHTVLSLVDVEDESERAG